MWETYHNVERKEQEIPFDGWLDWQPCSEQVGRERRPTWLAMLGFQMKALQWILFSFSLFNAEVLFLIHVWKLTFFKKNTFISVFILFLAALGLRCCARASLVALSRGYSSLWCAGFSLWWLLLLWSMGSRRMGFSSCSTQAQ